MLVSLLLVSVFSLSITAQTVTFNFTGSVQTYTVPPSVTTINVTVLGAKGGTGPSAMGGLGGSVQATIPVTPGEILNIYVGQVGINNVLSSPPVYNGGGGVYSYSSGGTAGTGGGASDIRRTPYANNDRLVVAGGGGGGGYSNTIGGHGGGLIGQDGVTISNWPNANGKGGTQSVGGAGGIACCSCPSYTTSGTFAQGGNGSGDGAGGGGGGGGYYGGGGACFSGGGGGSSYTNQTVTAVVHAQGFQNGAGQVVITPGQNCTPPAPASIIGSSSFCQTSSANFSINPVVGATSYTWSVPVGSTINSGQGTTSINVTFGNASGNISVTANNSCGSSLPTILAVIINPNPTVIATSSSATVCAGTSVTLTGGGASTYTWDNNVMDAVSFVPTATTTYMVTGTDANACVNTATITLIVNPLPIVTATSTAPSVCTGGSVTLTGGGASTYTWDNNVIDAVSFVPTATTTYMVTGTDVNGCVNTAMITVTVNPLPVVTANSSAASVCTGGSVTLTGGGASTYTWDNNVIDAVSFVPSATTTYMVTGTDVNGCVNTATTTVTLSGLLIISLGPDLIQCGGTALLDAGNMGSTYLWSNASTTQTITVSASGTYIVVVTDVNGCNGSDTAVVTINSNPSVSAAASSNVVCVDDADVSLIGTPIGGVWSGPGVNGLLLNPTAAGLGLQSAVYSYTDVNGCEGMDSVSIQVNACVGLAENILANGVSVYPNPNSGTFIVSVNMNVDELTLEMLDLQGRVVCYAMENNIQSGFTKQINMENVANGVYMLRITTSKEQVSLKVAVQK